MVADVAREALEAAILAKVCCIIRHNAVYRCTKASCTVSCPALQSELRQRLADCFPLLTKPMPCGHGVSDVLQAGLEFLTILRGCE